MRPTWTGSISFGLLNVPVQLYTATRDIGLHFKQLDGRDKSPIRYQRLNTATGQEVPWEEIVKGWEVRKGSFLIVDEDELKRAAPEQTETIDIESFVDRSEVDPIYFEKPYYVAPAKKAQKGYVLLREALERSGKLGIARIVLRTRQYLAALHPEGEALVLTLMRFPEEMVEPKAVGLTAAAIGKPKVHAAELEMAEKLLEAMAKPWQPADYKDEFRPRLRQLLERRAKKGGAVQQPERAPEAEAPTSNVIDLVSILQQSLEGKQGREGKRAGPRHAAARPRKPSARPRRRAS